MGKGPRPAAVRFYVDADMLGLGKLLAGLRSDFTHPGDPGDEIKRRFRPACPITKAATLDPDWIPVVAKEGWLIITRDAAIQENLAELEAVRSNNARMVNFSGDDARDTWSQLQLFMRYWPRIEQAATETGPFIYQATLASGLRPLDLDRLLDPRPRRRRQTPSSGPQGELGLG